ncbi:hypothetical protein [Ereboglobus luteus]|uniref:hypothetical protein n=1 Tax=Ereboglobus luteus TaxID=1796921 RepID=UPI0013750E36|nr:hypothetical protein [Ereboglobus luteus]
MGRGSPILFGCEPFLLGNYITLGRVSLAHSERRDKKRKRVRMQTSLPVPKFGP